MVKAKTRGFVIAIDGPDGVGKTTQVRRLVEYLQSRNKNVHKVRHSGGTPIGKELRAVSLSSYSRPPETDFYISLAMHADLAGHVQKDKANGQVIIMDRSPLAMLAYNAYGDELSDKEIAYEACETMLEDLEIDTLIFLTASPQVIEQRRTSRGAKDYFESKDKPYHQRVLEGYLAGVEFLKHHPKLCDKVTVINSDDDIDRVHAQIIKTLPKSL